MQENRKHSEVLTVYIGSLLKIMFLLYKVEFTQAHNIISLSVGWGQCSGWPGEAHTNLRGLQCQPKSPSAGQLVGYTLPVQALSAAVVCHAAFLRAWLCQPAFAITHLQRDAHAVLQTGQLPEGTGEDLGGWGEAGNSRTFRSMLNCHVITKLLCMRGNWSLSFVKEHLSLF